MTTPWKEDGMRDRLYAVIKGWWDGPQDPNYKIGALADLMVPAVEAEVARLTAHGKELRDALGLALSDRGMTPENGNHNRQRNCRTCGAASILGEPAGHADWCWVGESEKALSTPAGSDEPLRRVRAEAWDEAIKALDHFGYMPVNPYRTVVPERGGEGGSR